MQKISRALISVSDKEGILELARALHSNGVEIIASDGTADYLRQHSIEVRTVSELTGAPELLGGKVKTLHPAIHAAILVNRQDQKEMSSLGDTAPIDAVIVNLYPQPGFDIGGPALIRAAAKNADYVSVITSPHQYQTFIELLPNGITSEHRQQWAHQALVMTAAYDLALAADRGKKLRYGENPHQNASLLVGVANTGVAASRIIQGKEMSFNNYLDLDTAWKIAMDHRNSAVIVKHGIPTGVACSQNSHDAYVRAIASDPVSAFGGVVAFNCEVDARCAEEILGRFTEVVAAPAFSQEALEIFSRKPNIRIVAIAPSSQSSWEITSIDGGFLAQEEDTLRNDRDSATSWNLVAGDPVTLELLSDLEFAWKVVARTRSNSIVIARSGATIGIGAGNVNRLDAASTAVHRAQSHQSALLKGSVAASDAFFPFPDGLQVLIDAGVSAVVQPGGSVNDEAVIAAAKSAGISLYFSGIRHFSH